MYVGQWLLGTEADHLPPYDSEVKKEWSYTSTPTHIP